MSNIESIFQEPTQLIEINHPDIPGRVRVFAKLEASNPTGSVKDRAAQQIAAELVQGTNSKLVKTLWGFAVQELRYNGETILDSTSGNYGIALARALSQRGWPGLLVAPGNTPEFFLKAIQETGTKVQLTDPQKGYHEAKRVAMEMANDDRFLYVDQYSNLGNVHAHFYGTGAEIWHELHGDQELYFVAGVGTGGTIIGVADYIKRQKPDAKAFSVHPSDDFPGIQGLQPLVSGRVESSLFEANAGLIDGRILVDVYAELVPAWEFLTSSGIMVGMSSGANLSAVIKLVQEQKLTEGTIVTILPDSYDRYRTTQKL